MGAPLQVSVSPLAAGQVADVSVEMVSPAATGLYSSKWRMTTPQGNFFGGEYWIVYNQGIYLKSEYTDVIRRNFRIILVV